MRNARREVFSYALDKFEFHNQSAINNTADAYTRLQEQLWSLFEEVPESLQILTGLGIKLAVVTNGNAEVQRGKLKRFQLTEYFDDVFIDTEVGISKPDVGIYQFALSRLHLTASQVWMIGDNLKWDVYAPMEIGITGVWNDFKKKGLPEDAQTKPDLIVHSMKEMVDIILSYS